MTYNRTHMTVGLDSHMKPLLEEKNVTAITHHLVPKPSQYFWLNIMAPITTICIGLIWYIRWIQKKWDEETAPPQARRPDDI